MNAQTKRSRFKVLWAKDARGRDNEVRDVNVGRTAPKNHEMNGSQIVALQRAKLTL